MPKTYVKTLFVFVLTISVFGKTMVSNKCFKHTCQIIP